jgi:hypothetical protein
MIIIVLTISISVCGIPYHLSIRRTRNSRQRHPIISPFLHSFPPHTPFLNPLRLHLDSSLLHSGGVSPS